MSRSIEVEAGWVGSRLEIFPVRMACGCIVDRKMRPETAAKLRRNEVGEIYSPSKCTRCIAEIPRATASCYFNGDEVRVAGPAETIHGGQFYPAVILEGHRKGERIYVNA